MVTSALVCLSGLALLAADPAPTAAPTLVISDGLACPDAAAVDAALGGLLPGPLEGERPDLLRLTQRGDGFDVQLSDGAGALLGEKRLPATGSCEERAQTVAVLVAAWETRWRPEPPTTLPRMAVEPAPSRSAVLPASAPVETTAVERSVPAAAPWEVDTRAGLLMSIAGGTVAPALTCAVGFTRRDAPLAIAVEALAVGSHDVPVGPAVARWRRLGGTIDLQARLRERAFVLEMHAAAALTALSIDGQAIPLTSSATVFDAGLLVGLRGQFRLAHLVPWVEASAVLWPSTHTVYLNGASDSRELPSFEVLLGAGVAFGARP